MIRYLSLLWLLSQLCFASDSNKYFFGVPIAQSELSQFANPIVKDQFKFDFFKYYLNRFLVVCISENCTSEADLSILKKMNALTADPKAGRVFFANSAGNFFPKLKDEEKSYLNKFGFYNNPNLFNIASDSGLRAGISSVGPGPIVINNDKIKDITFREAFKIYLHEYAHQIGLQDDTHRKIDQLVARLLPFFDTKSTSHTYKNISLFEYHALNVAQLIEVESNGEIAPFWLPNLVVTDNNQLFDFAPHIYKTIVKLGGYNKLQSAWITSPRIIGEKKIYEQSYLEIECTLGYAMEQVNVNTIGFDGNVTMLIPLRVENNQIALDLRKETLIMMKDFKQFQKSYRKLYDIIDVKYDKVVQDRGNINVEVTVKLRRDVPHEIEGVLINVHSLPTNTTSPFNYFFLPTNYIPLLEKIKLSDNVYKLKFKGGVPPYGNSELKIDGLLLKVLGKDYINYTIPIRPAATFTLANSSDVQNLEVDYIHMHSSTMSFTQGSDMKIHTPDLFMPFSFYKQAAIDNSVYLKVAFKQILKEVSRVRLLVEVQNKDGLVFEQKIIKIQDIAKSGGFKVENGERFFEATLDPIELKKAYPEALAFRIFGLYIAGQTLAEHGLFEFKDFYSKD